MKKISSLLMLVIALSSCGISRQAQQIKALEQCNYKLIDATNVTVAGTDVKKLINNQNINLVNIPALALGYLKQDIPLRAVLNLEINNPSSTTAGINNFDYKILINKQEIANGTVNQIVNVGAGQTVKVPVQLNANIFQFISNGKTLSDITAFLSGAAKGTEQKGMVTLQIKPSIMVAGALVKYPGFITIDKEVSSRILL